MILEDRVWEALDELGMNVLQVARQPSQGSDIWTTSRHLCSIELEDGHITLVVEITRITK